MTIKVDTETSLPIFPDIDKIIEDIVWDMDVSYIEAIVHYCEKTDADIEAVGKALDRNSRIKALLQKEAEELHYLPKTSRLPI